MRHIASDQLQDFAAVYDEDVELVSVTRPDTSALEAPAKRMITSRQLLESCWVQDAHDSDAAARALSMVGDSEVRSLVLDEISQASAMLAELVDCDRIGVRVEPLSSPMCPRFHVDKIPCRMLITLSGPGTEWIPNGDVDWTALADRDNQSPPLCPDGEIRQLPTGHWSLLKGGAWDDRFGGVVHRSPHDAGERLLLSLDPIIRVA